MLLCIFQSSIENLNITTRTQTRPRDSIQDKIVLVSPTTLSNHTQVRDINDEDQLKEIYAQRETDLLVELNALKRPANASVGIQSHEWPVTGYLLRCAINADPIEGNKLNDEYRLLQATLNETRSMVPFRGNVTNDIATTQGESSRLMKILIKQSANLIYEERNDEIRMAAFSKALGVGVCDTYSALAALLHSKKLLPGQHIKSVSNNNAKHAFSLFHGSDNFVLDAWAEGPVIRQEDARFASNETELEENAIYHYLPQAEPGQENKQTPFQVYEAFTKRIFKDPVLEDEIKKKNDYLEIKNYTFPTALIWPPTSVLSEAFLQRTHPKSLDNSAGGQIAPSIVDHHDEIRAVGVARHMGKSIPQAVQEAPLIVQAAINLDTEAKLDLEEDRKYLNILKDVSNLYI